jgi:transposase-like protein
MKNLDFKSLYSFIESNPTEQSCRKYFETIRWKDGIQCPHCQNKEKKIYRFASNSLYKCSACKKQFSLTKGTIFEKSHIPLRKWFALILLFSDKKSCSANYISRELNIAYSNAYFALHRIRKCMTNIIRPKLTGVVEIDETFVGGKNKNRHYKDRKPHSQGRCTKYKKPIIGMLSRETGEVRLLALSNLKKEGLQLLVRNKIEAGSTISTDEYRGYKGLNKFFTHGQCNHGAYQYVNDIYHTNSLEGFWGHVKRNINGIYHKVSRIKLVFYCREFEFRYNNRNLSLSEKFHKLLGQTFNIRLMRKDLD